MDTFAAVARVLFQGSPDRLLGSLLERAPDLKQDLFKFVSQWEHGDHVAIFNGVAAPLNSGRWPTTPDDELIWYLSEEMSGPWTTAGRSKRQGLPGLVRWTPRPRAPTGGP